jgi:MarR family transcriptional regulator, transcriptional regulator for hemolysin
MASTPSLGWSIGVLFRAWQENVATGLAHIPHGGRGFQILEALADDGLPTQAALGMHLGIDRTVLTYVLDDLVDAGLVERRTDASDRRKRRLALTEQGSGCLADLQKIVASSETDLLAGLSAEERAALERLLPRAATSIHSGDEHACTIVTQILSGEPAGAGKQPA